MPTADSDLLDEALDLSLEFGPDWLQPIQARLRARRPDVSAASAYEIDAYVRAERDWAHALVRRVAEGHEDERAARALITARMPWMKSETLRHLWSQGLYYAMR